MDYRGPDLEADLETIWRVATEGFPKMAESYRSANVAVHLTYLNSSGFDAAFLENWRAFRDQAEMILGHDASTLDATAVALSQAVVDYASQDAAAAAAISSAEIDLTDEVPSMAPPLYPSAFVPAGTEGATAPPRPDYPYTGHAPTIDSLMEKARVVDDKLYAAAYEELGWLEQGAVSVGELVGAETVGGEGYLFTSDKMKTMALDEVASYEGAIGSLASVITGEESGPFGEFMTEVNNARRALNPDKWDGEAARAFAENFLDTYEDTVATQRAMLGALHGAVVGYQSALADTYTAFDQIMDETINACNAVIQSEAARSRQLGLSILAAGISAVVMVEGKAALAFTLASEALKIAATTVQVGEEQWDGEQDVDGSGSSSPRTALIRNNLIMALDKAHGRLLEFDEQLATAMGKDYDTVRNGRFDPGTRLQLARPEIADNPEAL